MITLRKKKKTGGGSYGSYYKISKTRGVKVLYSEGFTSKRKALTSEVYKDAKLEASLLKQAQATGIVPRCYGVTLVKKGKEYAVGIVMQHLGNKTLADSSYCETAAYDEIMEKFEEFDIYHSDLHAENIMVYRGKIYAIDFSPDYVTIG
jgi:tRNA A-37 threonylcarbamoyl transferase component Bud32